MAAVPSRVNLILHGGSHATKTYVAGVAPLDVTDAEAFLRAWLTSLSSQPLAIQSRLLDASKTVQFAVVSTGKIFVVSSPFFVNDLQAPAPADVNLVVGNMSNNLTMVTVVSIPLASLLTSVVTLVPRRAATDLGLKTVPNIQTDNVDSASNPVVAASLARLNFPNVDGTDPDTMPTFVALPKVFVLPKGCSFPSGMLLNAPATPETIDLPGFDVWRVGLHYLLQHNEGKSIHLGVDLFYKTPFQGADWQPFVGIAFEEDVAVTPHAMLPTSPLYGTVHAEVLRRHDDMLAFLGCLLHDQDVANGTGGACGLPPSNGGAGWSPSFDDFTYYCLTESHFSKDC
jgi:hypothetical protein